MEISSIRENIKSRIFNSTKHEATVARQSNPFSQISFKGNVLTADVFETSDTTKAEKNSGKLSFTGKLKASALVGSISNMQSKLQAGIESVVAFGKRMKESAVNTWAKLNEITWTDAVNAVSAKCSSMFENTTPKGLANKYNTEELGVMMRGAIAEYQAALV